MSRLFQNMIIPLFYVKTKCKDMGKNEKAETIVSTLNYFAAVSDSPAGDSPVFSVAPETASAVVSAVVAAAGSGELPPHAEIIVIVNMAVLVSTSFFAVNFTIILLLIAARINRLSVSLRPHIKSSIINS